MYKIEVKNLSVVNFPLNIILNPLSVDTEVDTRSNTQQYQIFDSILDRLHLKQTKTKLYCFGFHFYIIIFYIKPLIKKYLTLTDRVSSILKIKMYIILK